MLRSQGFRSTVLLFLLFILSTETPCTLAQEIPQQEIHQEEVRPPEPRPVFALPEGFERIRPEGEETRLLERINPFGLPARVIASLTIAGEYNDNVFEREREREEDVFVRISPGLALNFLSPRAFLNLGYSGSGTYYERFHQLNDDFTSHTLSATAGARPTRFLSISVEETFVRSDDLLETGALLQTGGRQTSTRNSVTPQFTYTPTRELSTSLRYNNTFIRNEADDRDDSDVNSARGSLRYTYGPESFLQAGYEYTRAKFSISPDFTGHQVDATLTHAFSRLTTGDITSTYFLQDRRREDTRDIVTWRTTLGVVRRLTPRLTGRIAGGVGIFDVKGGRDTIGPEVNLQLDWISQPLTVTATYGLFLNETFSEAENVGTTLTHRTGILLRYFFTRELLGRVGATYSRVEVLESTGVAGSVEGRVDDVISANVDFSYQIFRWLFLTVGYNLFKRESTNVGSGLFINQIRVSLTTQYTL